MHVGNMSKGMIPGIAIVGGGIPLAAGMALAFKMQKSDRVAACFFGDGAVAEGAFHEGVNMAAIWDLPVVFVCENNLYGASTHVVKVMRDTNIARRVPGATASAASRSTATTCWPSSRRPKPPSTECRGGRRARAAGTADLPPDRPLPARSRAITSRKKNAKPGPPRTRIRRFARVLKSHGIVDDAGLAAYPRRTRPAVRRGGRPRPAAAAADDPRSHHRSVCLKKGISPIFGRPASPGT